MCSPRRGTRVAAGRGCSWQRRRGRAWLGRSI
jgi:hypothetical protein